MSGRSISRRITLPWDDERGGVGTEVEEELRDYIQGEHGVGGETVGGEAKDAKQGGKNKEAKELQRLATYGVDGEYRGPVPWDRASDGKNYESDGGVMKFVVEVGSVVVAC